MKALFQIHIVFDPKERGIVSGSQIKKMHCYRQNKKEIETLMKEAIQFHLEGMKEDGLQKE